MELIHEFPALGRSLGPGLFVIGLSSLTAFIVGCIFQEWDVLLWMLIVPMILCTLGVSLWVLPKTDKQPRTGTSIAATAVIWLLVGICGSLPFLYICPTFVDAVFESMSAWTGTGFSVVTNIESWPKTLLFWRSFMQWIGGLGIIAFALSVGKRSGLLRRGLYRSEGRTESFMPSVLTTALHMWKIYAILTAIAIIAILLTGVGIWDSINLALCTISTGGLSIYAAGISHFDNFALEMVLIPIMIAGAIPFRLYYLTYNRKSLKEALHDRVLHAILIIFGILSVIIILELILSNGFTIPEALRQGLFMAGTAVSSTGFQNTSFVGWGIAPLILLGIFMLIGGAQGSTAGGFKIERILIVIESIKMWIRRAILSPRTVISMHHNNKIVDDNNARKIIGNAFILIIFSVCLILVTFIIFMHDPYFSSNSLHTLFDLMSCFGNNGVSSGMIGPLMPDYAKIIITIEMWIARLEIIPVMILIWGCIRGFNWESVIKRNKKE